MIAARIMMKGFIYADYLSEMPDFYRDVGGWIESGQVKSRETIHNGFEAPPTAFVDLFAGGNMGRYWSGCDGPDPVRRGLIVRPE